MILTQPRGMQLHDWADQVVFELGAKGAWGKLQGDDWQDWGAQFANTAALGNQIPNPYNFSDWQDWGERLCQTVR